MFWFLFTFEELHRKRYQIKFLVWYEYQIDKYFHIETTYQIAIVLQQFTTNSLIQKQVNACLSIIMNKELKKVATTYQYMSRYKAFWKRMKDDKLQFATRWWKVIWLIGRAYWMLYIILLCYTLLISRTYFNKGKSLGFRL